MKQSSSGAAVKKPGSATAVKKPGSAPASVARSRSGSPRLTSAGAGTLKASSDGDKAKTLHQPPQPRGLPPQPEHRKPIRPKNVDILATAVQAAAELTEIGLSAGARALRDALSRLPRP